MPKKTSTTTKNKKTSRSAKTSKVKVVSNGKSSRSRLGSMNGRTKLLAFVLAFAIVGTITLLLTMAANASGPIVGIAGKCLDNNGNHLRDKNKIQLYKCNGSAAQKWTVRSDGTIHLTDNYCLDVKYAGTKSGTLVWLYGCNGTVAQQWKVNSDGSVVNPHSGLCLDDQWSKTANGNTIWVFTCNGTSAQKWKVPKTAQTGGNGSSTGGTGGSTSGSGGTAGSGGSGSGGSSGGSSGSGGGTTGGGLCTTIPSTPGTKPTASNTGVPAGTSLSTTPPAGVTVTGDSWKVTANGTVIDGKDIQNKWLDVEASNVVVKNSRIHAPNGGGSGIARGNNDNVSNLTVLNSEVYTSSGGYNGILAGSGSRICGVNAHNFENIAEVEGTDIIVQSNYFHVNQAQPGKSDPHNDGLEVRAGSGIKVLGNNITQTNPDGSWQHNTSALYLGATYGDLDKITVSGNWFGGGTYSLYMVTVPRGAHKLGTFDVTNNKWYRGSYEYGPVSTDDGSSWKPHTWTNNVFEDNGQSVGM